MSEQPDPCVSDKTSDKVKYLIGLLREAAEIEQQFMCMYLYGAYSVKKRYIDGQFADVPDNVDAMPPAEVPLLEEARRWVSEIYSVARQEMEHLALVNNMLRAIGAAPYFSRINIQEIMIQDKMAPEDITEPHIFKRWHLGAEGEPMMEVGDQLIAFSTLKANPDMAKEHSGKSCDCHYPISFPFQFTPFSQGIAEAWTCMESPGYDTLKEFGPDLFADWCFSCEEQTPEKNPLDGSFAGKINILYEKIRDGFEALDPEDYLVKGDDQVSIIQQYDIYVFPVTDFASASQAIDLIVKQGEGNDASIDYQSHYRRFFEIATNYPQPQVPLYWDLKVNPLTTDIDAKYPSTVSLFELSNQSYELLVIILTALYALPQNPKAAPYLAPALKQEAFAPMMTMIIRSLSELLVQLKANDNDMRVASSFELRPDVNELLLYPYKGMNKDNADCVFQGKELKDEIGNLNNILARFTDFNNKLQKVELQDFEVANTKLIDWAKNRLAYIKENSQRIQVNLSRINQTGIYSLLDSGE